MEKIKLLAQTPYQLPNTNGRYLPSPEPKITFGHMLTTFTFYFISILLILIIFGLVRWIKTRKQEKVRGRAIFFISVIILIIFLIWKLI